MTFGMGLHNHGFTCDILAETRIHIPEASVGDAAMMMDLRNTTALMFRNSATGSYNMAYRREDGTVGWMEPKAT